MLRQGLQPIMNDISVAGLSVDYLAPVEFGGEPIQVELWVGQIKAASFLLHYAVHDHKNGKLQVRAQTLMVPYDLAAGRVRRLTPGCGSSSHCGRRTVPAVTELVVPDPAERDDLGAFVARAVRLDQGTVIRLKQRQADDADRVDVWASTPFETLATRSVGGSVVPADLTVAGPELLAALTIVGKERVDPGAPRDLLWRSPLPPAEGWRYVDQVPPSVLNELADQGVRLAREHAGPRGTPPAALLDQTVLTVSGGGDQVKIPLRCLFALAGMGLISSASTDEPVKVSATPSWLRIDARYGAVLRRRHVQLPLLV